ncbi:MAG TPA: hypothetical protein GX526_00265 [Thermoanaerobacterales bacterium]|nr:hypothetical protein [Thermoanaerobacterales bacterium]
MQIPTHSGRSFSRSFKMIMFFFSFFLIYSGILKRQFFRLIVGAAFFISCFFDKEVVITEDGVLYKRNNLGRYHEELLPFTEFVTLGIEPKGERTVLHLLKGQMVRVVTIDSKYADDVAKMAKKSNKKIILEKIDPPPKMKFRRKKSKKKRKKRK